LLKVYQTINMLIMDEQRGQRLNHLLRQLGDTDLASARWLRANGYSGSLLARYVRSGWLVSPARGVYMSARARLHWMGVMHSLQQRESLQLHVGGRFALAWRGHEHGLRLGNEADAVTLYGTERLPAWVQKLPLRERFIHCGPGPFAPAPWPAPGAIDAPLLADLGLELESGPRVDGVGIVMASNERAMLELCDEPPGEAQILEADLVMQGLAGLRPALVTRLLRACRSVKAKRLFLALADRHGHPWRARVSLEGVDLGSGKRVLAKGGRLHRTYLITLPEALDEHMG
jgi:hypothetical protein